LTFKYKNKKEIQYYSRRYNRSVTVPEGYPSDGATFAVDIYSDAWWVHDLLCDRGTWNNGTPCTNIQASWVLSDILNREKRVFRAVYWFWGTLFFGGKKLRKENGLFRLKKEKR
tara:strand:+ start:4367 stop:4708 length:342 start_codon:yes stop_codon:yes gene_type:complete